jgi:hypothetical protein
LVEDANHCSIFSLPADLESEANVETHDKEVSTYEGKYGSEAHADCEELIGLSPPKIDDDDRTVEEFDYCGESNAL